MSKLRNALLTGLAWALFTVGVAACQPQNYPIPTPVPRESRLQQTKAYLQNVKSYTPIPIDTWSIYNPEGLGLFPELRGKDADVLSAVASPDNSGAIREYLEIGEFSEGQLIRKYFGTRNDKGEPLELETEEEVLQKIDQNYSSLFAVTVNSIDNNKNAVPETEEIMGSENPYVVGMALQSVSRNVEVIDFANGEVYPFIDYATRLNSGRIEFELSAVAESAATYYLMSRLGLGYNIPFVEKNFGIIVGENVAKDPRSTKTNVKISYEPAGNVHVTATASDSILTRIGKYTYVSLRHEELTPPEKEYKVEAEIDPEETLRNIAEFVKKKNEEEEARQEQRDLGSGLSQGMESLKQFLEERDKIGREKEKKSERQTEELKEKIKQGTEEVFENVQEKGKELKKAFCEKFPSAPRCKK